MSKGYPSYLTDDEWGGIQWEMLPSDVPPYKTVYDHYNRLCKRGVWEDFLNQKHREKKNP